MKFDADMEAYALSLVKKAKTHDEWLSWVKFGIRELLDNGNVLAKIIFDEAQEQAVRLGAGSLASDHVWPIMQELNLTFNSSRNGNGIRMFY